MGLFKHCMIIKNEIVDQHVDLMDRSVVANHVDKILGGQIVRWVKLRWQNFIVEGKTGIADLHLIPLFLFFWYPFFLFLFRFYSLASYVDECVR